MKRIPLVLCACLVAAAAWPAYGGKDHVVVLDSLMVRGTISVSPAGHVTGYTMYKPEKLPAGVVNLLNRAIPDWRFHPVSYDGKPAAAKADMSIRLLARPLDNKRYSLSIASTSFTLTNNHSSAELHYAKDHRKPPKYPVEARRNHVSGTVYLLVRINRQGNVANVATREVDLRVWGTPAQLRQWRGLLSRASLEAARHWHFRIPADVANSNKSYWYGSVPVDFQLVPSNSLAYLRKMQLESYGKWQAFIPGPMHYIPWADKHEMANVNTAQPSGSLHILGQGLRRIDPHHG